jgi:hypothetical protein
LTIICPTKRLHQRFPPHTTIAMALLLLLLGGVAAAYKRGMG